jgi:hypothetical protein
MLDIQDIMDVTFDELSSEQQLLLKKKLLKNSSRIVYCHFPKIGVVCHSSSQKRQDF